MNIQLLKVVSYRRFTVRTYMVLSCFHAWTFRERKFQNNWREICLLLALVLHNISFTLSLPNTHTHTHTHKHSYKCSHTWSLFPFHIELAVSKCWKYRLFCLAKDANLCPFISICPTEIGVSLSLSFFWLHGHYYFVTLVGSLES